ncbi:MAG: TolC family protein [Verrucomicrobia bacterium]|nr:TolC family protein [Verrucomicrobiota bacterium]
MNKFRGKWSEIGLLMLLDLREQFRRMLVLIAMGMTLVLSACTAAQYRKFADKEASGILSAKAGQVPNVDSNFSIEPLPRIVLENLVKSNQRSDFLGKSGERAEKGADILALADALELAIKHNRTYLTSKETIYLEALALTLARWDFAPIFSGGGGAGRGRDFNGAPGTTAQAAGSAQRGVDAVIARNTFTRQGNAGVSMLQRTGARIAVDFTTDFLKILGGDRSINNSRLAVTLTQPLLKGGGYLAVMENLTQAERNLLYSLRDFANFRREFIVGIVSDYYNILRARDRVRNNWIGYQGFVKSVERETALAEEDRRTMTQLGLLQQASLRNEVTWVNALQAYQQLMDEFKITLGLPVESKVVLDMNELAKLDIELPKLTRMQAVYVAIASRPDLINASDRRVDAARKIRVAAVDLRPGLDVTGGYDANSPSVDGTPNLDFKRSNWNAALELELPFDRKEERNNYRAAIIALEQSKRNLELAYDQVKLEIFNDWRALDQAQQNFEISELGVKLAERRLEEQELLAELGQGAARDQVEAQQDLTNSQNQRTSAIVDHTLARLGLWQDMGILFINKDGSWVTKLEEEANE